MPYKRLNVSGIKDGVSEQRRFIQINIGSRQAGKFTPASLRHDRRRWLRCMNASVIEPSIVNDAMRLIEVRNPELMRRLFSVDVLYSGQGISYRKLLAHDTALMTTAFGRKRNSLLTDPDLRGRLVKTAVGAYLVNLSYSGDVEVFWWRDGNLEMDFVVTCEDAVCAIEVRGGRVKPTRGMSEFIVGNPNARSLVVGSRECPLEDFLSGRIDLFG